VEAADDVSGGLVVITSCTATKVHLPSGEDCTAESLYTGQQHVRLMRGVETYRAAGQPAGSLRFRILSAFHGLLRPSARVSTYDHTFAGQSADVIRREAYKKNVPAAIRAVLREPFDAGVLLLGDPYLRACDLTGDVRLGGPVVSFCSPAVARRTPPISGLRTVPLTNADARRFSCGLIALKGELGRRLLARLAEEPGEIANLTSRASDVLSWLEAAPRLHWEAAA
jgi:hypothetical protein